MTSDGGSHVFISYVREDAEQVDRLCEVLDAAQIPYWRDSTALAPGDAWKAKIRTAIKDGSLVFLACFSDASVLRDKSVMNEELTLAVEEYRQMPPGRTWLIPVRLDDVAVPTWDLGAGRMLGDLNYVSLFGDRFTPEAVSLVTTITRVLGEKTMSSADALASVQAATDADRVVTLVRLTKEMIPDSSRRIDLDDLIAAEVRRVREAIDDEVRFPRILPEGTNDEHLLYVAETAVRYWTLVEPFTHSLRIAARWAEADALAPWVSGIRAFATAATATSTGHDALMKLRHIPTLTSVMTCAIACASSARWANLNQLIITPTVPVPYERGSSVSVLETTNPWTPFPRLELAVNAMVRSQRNDEPLADAIAHYRTLQGRGGGFRTPVAEWLLDLLHPVFVDQFHTQDEYQLEFDRAEVILGALSFDCAAMRSAASDRTWMRGSDWFGRSTWRAELEAQDAARALSADMVAAGISWAPLAGGLFGGQLGRAQTAVEGYAEEFEKAGHQHRFR